MIYTSLLVLIAFSSHAFGSLEKKHYVLDERQASPFAFCADPAVVIAQAFVQGLAPLKPRYCASYLNVATTTGM